MNATSEKTPAAAKRSGLHWAMAAGAIVAVQLGTVLGVIHDSETGGGATAAALASATEAASGAKSRESAWFEPILPAAVAGVRTTPDAAEPFEVTIIESASSAATSPAAAPSPSSSPTRQVTTPSASVAPSMNLAGNAPVIDAAPVGDRKDSLPLAAVATPPGESMAATPAEETAEAAVEATPAAASATTQTPPRPRLRPASLPRRALEPTTPAGWVASRASAHLTLQLASLSERAGQRRFLRENNLGAEGRAVKLTRGGQTRFVILYGDYRTRGEAEAAARRVAKRHGVEPWIRRFGDVQAQLSATAAARL